VGVVFMWIYHKGKEAEVTSNCSRTRDIEALINLVALSENVSVTVKDKKVHIKGYELALSGDDIDANLIQIIHAINLDKTVDLIQMPDWLLEVEKQQSNNVSTTRYSWASMLDLENMTQEEIEQLGGSVKHIQTTATIEEIHQMNNKLSLSMNSYNQQNVVTEESKATDECLDILNTAKIDSEKFRSDTMRKEPYKDGLKVIYEAQIRMAELYKSYTSNNSPARFKVWDYQQELEGLLASYTKGFEQYIKESGWTQDKLVSKRRTSSTSSADKFFRKLSITSMDMVKYSPSKSLKKKLSNKSFKLKRRSSSKSTGI